MNDRFATSRTVIFPAYVGIVEYRNLNDGSLIWDKSLYPTSKLYVKGMTEDAIYVSDYETDSLYALNHADGSANQEIEAPSLVSHSCHICRLSGLSTARRVLACVHRHRHLRGVTFRGPETTISTPGACKMRLSITIKMEKDRCI